MSHLSQAVSTSSQTTSSLKLESEGNVKLINLERFVSAFSLPEGTIDKLETETAKYPEDHVANFKGNIDDEFRVGVRYQGGGGGEGKDDKDREGGWKLWTEFYKSDLIIASPLGMRKGIESSK
jgi:U3 small nucleolar RNA-associated protein 25